MMVSDPFSIDYTQQKRKYFIVKILSTWYGAVSAV